MLNDTELLKALETVRQRLLNNSSQKALAKWIKDTKKTKGFSESMICDIFSGRKVEVKTRKLIQLATEFDSYADLEPIESKQQADTKLRLFQDKSFYIYFYDEDAGNANIGRAVLSISKENIATIKNIKEREIFTTDYTGIATLDKKQDYLILNMHTVFQEKDLHIRFRIPSDEKVAQYAIGGYMVTNNSSTLALGTLVLEYDGNRKKNDMEARTIEPETILYQELSQNIRKFLKKRENNYIKMMTKVVFTDKEFELFFDAQKSKIFRRKEVIDSANIFISYVTRTISDAEVSIHLDFLHEIKTAFIKMFKCEVYFEGMGEYKRRSDFKPAEVAIPKNIDKLNNADKFVLIYSKVVASSALTELGIAIAQNKSIVIFHKSDHLPWLIQNSAYIPNAHINRIIYKDETDLIQKIRKDIFK